MGLYTGIGRYSSDLYRILKPKMPLLRFYSTNYFDIEVPKGSHSISQKYAHTFFQVPLINRVNSRRLMRDFSLFDSNIHLLGNDYSLTSTIKNTVITLHELYFVLPNFLYNGLKIDTLKDLSYDFNILKTIKYSKKAKGIIVPSQYVSDQVKRKLRLPTTVIHHPVNKNIFQVRNKVKIRIMLGLPLDKKLLLNVSGGGANKNLVTLERIAVKLNDSEILVKINTNISGKNVINIGQVNDNTYPLYFSAADAYLHTSTNEGFGIPLIESLSSGLPVIANKLSTSKEILSDAGVYVSNPYDPQEYLDLFRSFFASKVVDELSIRSLERSSKFSDDIAAAKYISFYKKVFIF